MIILYILLQQKAILMRLRKGGEKDTAKAAFYRQRSTGSLQADWQGQGQTRSPLPKKRLLLPKRARNYPPEPHA
jgi:hypothetical protein